MCLEREAVVHWSRDAYRMLLRTRGRAAVIAGTFEPGARSQAERHSCVARSSMLRGVQLSEHILMLLKAEAGYESNACTARSREKKLTG